MHPDVPASKQLPFFVNLSLVNEDAPNQSCHVGEWYILTIPAQLFALLIDRLFKKQNDVNTAEVSSEGENFDIDPLDCDEWAGLPEQHQPEFV